MVKNPKIKFFNFKALIKFTYYSRVGGRWDHPLSILNYSYCIDVDDGGRRNTADKLFLGYTWYTFHNKTKNIFKFIFCIWKKVYSCWSLIRASNRWISLINCWYHHCSWHNYISKLFDLLQSLKSYHPK